MPGALMLLVFKLFIVKKRDLPYSADAGLCMKVHLYVQTSPLL